MQAKNRATQVASLAIGMIVVAAGSAYANARHLTAFSKAEPSIALPSSCGSCLHHSGILVARRPSLNGPGVQDLEARKLTTIKKRKGRI
jgi:hypothetical protein